jgi:hypothetical protein
MSRNKKDLPVAQSAKVIDATAALGATTEQERFTRILREMKASARKNTHGTDSLAKASVSLRKDTQELALV